MAPKPILKKSQSRNPRDELVDKSDGDSKVVTEKHREIAVHHAHLLQQRKDIEATNLSAIEELIEFPTDPSADVVHPPPSNLARFRELIQSFQPSDYDELLTERNCLDKCAYVFCPRRRRHELGRGVVRLQAGGRDHTKFLSGKQIEMWCSDGCARRALYIRVQLSEQPAWERSWGYSTPIDLLDESGQQTIEAKVGEHRVGDADDNEAIDNALAKLAMERGEQTGSSKPQMVLAERLKENVTVSSPAPPSVCPDNASTIEGYEPKGSETIVEPT